MGQTISGLIDSLQNNEQKEKLANDAMSSLLELARMQEDAFMLSISNPNFDAKLIPIDQIIDMDHVIQANISNEPDDIGAAIKETFSSFASGDVADGIAKLVSNGLNLLMGSYSGNSSVRDTYAIATGAIGGVYRLDMHFYSYRYTSKQLTDIAKQVLLVSIVVSSVDLRAVSDDSLRVIVQETYGSSPLDKQEAIYEQLRDARLSDNMQSQTTASRELKLAAHKMNQVGQKRKHPTSISVSQPFTIETGINEANKSHRTVENWLSGSLVTACATRGLHLYEMSVECAQDDQSTSDSKLSGVATIVLDTHKPIQDPKSQLKSMLYQSLEGVQNSGISQIPMRSFTVGQTKKQSQLRDHPNGATGIYI